MTCIDFNLLVYDNRSGLLQGANHERRSNCILTDHGPLSARRFKSCVDRYRGDHRIKTFTCLDRYYCKPLPDINTKISVV